MHALCLVTLSGVGCVLVSKLLEAALTEAMSWWQPQRRSQSSAMSSGPPAQAGG